MSLYQFGEITTSDQLVHQGLFFVPENHGTKAVLWIHGLTDTFYGDIKTFEEFIKQFGELGWGFASFNNRGHDVITSITKLDSESPKGKTHSTQGAACEIFTDCVYDIDAAISFLEEKGFSEIILVGISTGANKACYYEATKHDPRVTAVVLASAISDVGIKKKELGAEYEKTIRKVRELVEQGKGENFIEGLDYMPITPKRFLSAYLKNTPEDVFPYYQSHPKFEKFKSITKPLMVILGERDEYADIPVQEMLKIYSKYHASLKFKGVIIPEAFHSFGGHEKEFVQTIRDWVKTI